MGDDITLGLVPVHDDAETAAGLETIARALGRIAGVRCSIHSAISPSSLVFAYESGVVNMLWSSPTLVLTATELRDAVPLVSSMRQGMAHYHGVLFVRPTSPIRSPLALSGARAAWVAPTSAAGYIFPRVALAGHGIDPDGLFADDRFFGSHGGVVRAVLDGEADVGATFAVFEEGDATKPMIRAGFLDVAGGEELRVLLSTPPIPADLVVASRTLCDGHRGRLPGLLRQLVDEEPAAVKQVLGAEGFAECDRRQLEALRRQLDDARALGVLDGSA